MSQNRYLSRAREKPVLAVSQVWIRIIVIFWCIEKRIHSMVVQELASHKKKREECPIVIKHVRETSIFFNAWFESGNLREVEKLSESEYNLFLHFDFNTLNYT